MALLAENLVDEWLNRQGFFTIRGLKQTIEEIDLLAIKYGPTPSARHVEVQISFRPVSYITPLTRDLQKELGKSRSSAFHRKEDQLKLCVVNWVDKKFKDKDKAAIREALWSGLKWEYILVHGVVKHKEELQLIADCGVTLKPLSEILADLCWSKSPPHTVAAGGDLADLIRYYAEGRKDAVSS